MTWPGAQGFRRVLGIGLPLMASMASNTVMLLADRAFLGGYSLEALAAAGAAGQVNVLCLGFFMGVAGYLSVFVAQFVGAGQRQRVGAVVWLGLYFALLTEAVLVGLSFLAGPIFALAGHGPELAEMEVEYFRLLCLGGGLFVAGPAFTSFFAGQGRTRPVLLVNLASAVFFIPLDYALINGWGPFPEMGVRGAALASLLNWTLVAGLFCRLVFTPAHDQEFGLRQGRAWDRALFARLWRQGLGGGLQFMVEVLAVTWFMFVVGRLGTEALAVSSMVLTIDTVAFTPMVGLMVAVSTLTGQAVGRGQPQEAREPVAAALAITLAYVSLAALIYWVAPGWLLSIFRPRQTSVEDFAALAALGAGLLRIASVYRVFSAFGLVSSGALRGVGDIRFLTLAMAATATAVLGLPLALAWPWLGLWGCWSLFGLYIAALALVFNRRFHGGAWRHRGLV
jgi:MATE family multidrug resistance protein